MEYMEYYGIVCLIVLSSLFWSSHSINNSNSMLFYSRVLFSSHSILLDSFLFWFVYQRLLTLRCGFTREAVAGTGAGRCGTGETPRPVNGRHYPVM